MSLSTYSAYCLEPGRGQGGGDIEEEKEEMLSSGGYPGMEAPRVPPPHPGSYDGSQNIHNGLIHSQAMSGNGHSHGHGSPSMGMCGGAGPLLHNGSPIGVPSNMTSFCPGVINGIKVSSFVLNGFYFRLGFTM